MAKIENEVVKDDELLLKLKTALVETCLMELENVRKKIAKNPENIINSAIEIYKALK